MFLDMQAFVASDASQMPLQFYATHNNSSSGITKFMIKYNSKYTYTVSPHTICYTLEVALVGHGLSA